MKNLTALNCLIGLILASTTVASIIEVPSQQPTIQAGIDAASQYDTVLVADGYYIGDGNRDIDFGGKDVYLTSVNGAEHTTIDCAATEYSPHRAFYLHSGESELSVIQGFTITGAYGDGSYLDAAVRCENASPRLRYCVITENDCHGVMYANDTLRIDDCVVSNNTGHGITSNEGAVDIRNCEISYNGQCGFYWNAQWYGFLAEVTDCLVVGNGDIGVYLLIGSGLFHVQNCTMVGNEIGFSYDWNFPKVASEDAASVAVDSSTVENCIMAFNEVYGTLCFVWAGPVIVRCNDAFGNGVDDFHDEGFGPDDDYGNISANPLFCDAGNNDYHLSSVSPCLPSNNDCGVLMGLYGAGCSTGKWTVNADGSGDAPTIQAAIDIASDWDTVMCTPGTYTGDGNRDIDFNGKKILLLGEQGQEMTIIDCEGSAADEHRAFYFHSGEDTVSIIDGFTITNAHDEDEGAIVMVGANPRLRNLVVTGNVGCGVYAWNTPWGNREYIIERCLVNNNTADGVQVSNGWLITIDECDISHNGVYGVIVLWSGTLDMTYSTANHNGEAGVFMLTANLDFFVSNCTFVGNRIGFFWDMNYPAAATGLVATSVDDSGKFLNSICAFNSYVGVISYFHLPNQKISCCNSFGNGVNDWVAGPFEAGDDYDNFSADPMFCDMDAGDYTISTFSPCAPAYSPCGLLVGAFGDSCSYTDAPAQTDEPLPSTFSLGQNYPNPFNPATEILFELPSATRVKLEIFNMAGQRVTTLVDERLLAGKHRISWDASKCASGVYLYRLEAGDFSDSKKMILLK